MRTKESGVRGVRFHKWFKTPTWLAEITVNGNKKHLGYFRSMDDAVAARRAAEAAHPKPEPGGRTKQAFRDYVRKRRGKSGSRGRPKLSPEATVRHQARNQQQGLDVKTVGGRTTYFACTKTKAATPRLGIFAEERGSYKMNGFRVHGYSL